MSTFITDRKTKRQNSTQLQIVDSAQNQRGEINDFRQSTVAQREIIASLSTPLNPSKDVAQRVEDEEELHQAKLKSANPGAQQGVTQPIQRNENKTGMPDQLKSGIEGLSGVDMSNVRVHYNSPKPAQLNAHAYAQGTEIHLGSGQEKHLPHEAWHVVQQRQGRVKPTTQLAGAMINDDVSLEKEADVMGAKAIQGKFSNPPSFSNEEK